MNEENQEKPAVKYTLRPYQQAAVDHALEYAKKSLKPQIIVACTGAGKSLIISELAKELMALSGKRVLCLAPNAKLVIQNHEKYTSYGFEASIFSASAGQKCLKHAVTFGTPITVYNSIDMLNDYSAIIIDEADGLTKAVKGTIDALRDRYPNIRVIGLTATPYRMRTGFIYANHYRDGCLDADQTKDPYFHFCSYEVSAAELLAHDPPFLVLPKHIVSQLDYDTSCLVMEKTGLWNAESVDEAFMGDERLTADIVADIIAKTTNQRGVLIFGSTIAHCKEIMRSLPPELSALATGENRPERLKAEEYFSSQKIKYLVNVNTQSVGCDYPHADTVVMMRRTESPRLFTQMIGRILRIYPGYEKGAFILDYADNMENHFPNGDIFNPKIKVPKDPNSEKRQAICPVCGFENQFTAPTPDKDLSSQWDENGFYLDTTENRLLNTWGNPIPAHFGRRCQGLIFRDYRCEFQWVSKPCPECETSNDIAARVCKSCESELVDPNDKLFLRELYSAAPDIYSGKTKLANDKTHLWNMCCSYAKAKSLPDKQAARARALFRDISGEKCGKEFSFSEAANVSFNNNFLNKVRALAAEYYVSLKAN